MPRRNCEPEELRSLLWSDDTFVDFDTGLNTAVKRLRDTLGDSAENPTFIETIPRKGYKLIAPVEVIQRDGYKPNDEHLSGEGRKPTAVILPTPPTKKQHKKLGAIVSVSVAALLLLAGVIVWRTLPRLPKVTNVVQLTNDTKAKSFKNDSPVTDGLHLYFVEGHASARGWGVAQDSVAGGETSQLLTPLREISAIFDIAPNSSELLVGNGIGLPPDPATGRAGGALELWIQPLPGGTPHRVGSFWATSACYTAGGTRILYGDGRSWSSSIGTGVVLANWRKYEEAYGASATRPMVNGFALVIVGGPWMASSQWQIDANGTNLRQLLPNWKESPFQCCGSWSPDGKYYFFQAGQGDDQAIWIMPEHHFVSWGSYGKPTRLITGPLHLSAPVPSTDGKSSL